MHLYVPSHHESKQLTSRGHQGCVMYPGIKKVSNIEVFKCFISYDISCGVHYTQ